MDATCLRSPSAVTNETNGTGNQKSVKQAGSVDEVLEQFLSYKTTWWFQKFLMFTPKFGEMIPILTNIFQMGWFNHQPEKDGPVTLLLHIPKTN